MVVADDRGEQVPTAPPFDVCVVGSANLDLVATTDRHPAPGETVLGHSYLEHAGGKGLNQAVAAARSGARTVFVGAVGDDAAGDRLGTLLRDEGIGTEHLVVARGVPTGRALIVVDERAENSIVVVPGANHRVAIPDPLPSARVVLVQLEIPIDTVTAALVAARAAGAITVLNPAPAHVLSDELLASVDVVVPNEHETELAGGVDRLLGAGVGAVVVTRGSAGLDVHTATGRHHVAPYPVRPVDTTGAGDACCAYLAAGLARGLEVVDAARQGAAAGALATTTPGAVPGLPWRRAVEALVSGGAPAPPTPHE